MSYHNQLQRMIMIKILHKKLLLRPMIFYFLLEGSNEEKEEEYTVEQYNLHSRHLEESILNDQHFDCVDDHYHYHLQ